MDYHKMFVITSQNTHSGKYKTDVVIRGINLLGNGKSVKKVTLAGVPGNVILANKCDIFMYAGRGESGLQGDICIENELGEVVSGGSWKYD
jgi:hypothetical protein